MVNSNDGIKTEASTNYDMDTWGTLNAFDQCPINFILQNRFYFVFIAEFVKLLPIIFPVNIWSTYLFEIEHRTSTHISS